MQVSRLCSQRLYSVAQISICNGFPEGIPSSLLKKLSPNHMASPYVVAWRNCLPLGQLHSGGEAASEPG